MKRFTKTLVAAMIIAATGAVIMVGCKKEESAQMKDGVAQTEQSMSVVEQKVLDFLGAYEDMKQGAKIENETVSPEEARWQWETTLNYCYGFSLEYLTDLRVDTISLAMPKADETGNIAYNDMLNTYTNIVDAVRNTFKSIAQENKVLQFVMINLDNTKTEVDSISIVINTGSRGIDPGTPDPQPYPWYGIPFTEGECYRWGCPYWIQVYPNATAKLQNHIAAYDDIHAIAQAPHSFIVNPHHFVTYQGGVNEIDWLFSLIGLTEEEALNYQLCWEYLNWEYAQIMQHTHTPAMEIRPYGHDGYYQTRVWGKLQHITPTNDTVWISHVVRVDHATIYPIVNENYPVPIDE